MLKDPEAAGKLDARVDLAAKAGSNARSQALELDQQMEWQQNCLPEAHRLSLWWLGV
jgi:hypothetical protein